MVFLEWPLIVSVFFSGIPRWCRICFVCWFLDVFFDIRVFSCNVNFWVGIFVRFFD